MNARPCPSPIFGKGGWSLAWGLFFLHFHPPRTPIWKRLLLHGELTFLTCELKPLFCSWVCNEEGIDDLCGPCGLLESEDVP